VVEQSIALLHWFRRLRIRWEIRDDIHEALLSLASSIICWRRLTNLSLCQDLLGSQLGYRLPRQTLIWDEGGGLLVDCLITEREAGSL
jgi:hypothetical protein